MPEHAEVRALLEDAQARLASLHRSVSFDAKVARMAALEKKMAAPDFWNDQEAARTVVTEFKALKALLEPIQEVAKKLQDAVDMLDIAVEVEDEGEIVKVAAEAEALNQRLGRLELTALLSRPHDSEPCFFSIHTGAGGSDACEWTEMLLRMYMRFFERRGWKIEELSFAAGDEAGVKRVDLRVGGAYAYGYLRSEAGVHRLVRISPVSGKRETSFAAVDVVPDFQQEIEIAIEEKDLRVDTFRSSGKGGQHVNKTDSAVRITHIPTNIVVSVQNERSQHRNREMAMKILKSRLMAMAEAEREAQADAHNATKMENAWGSQIRSYVLHPYQMVKDLRTEHETGDIQKVLDGDLDDFLEAYLKWHAAR